MVLQILRDQKTTSWYVIKYSILILLFVSTILVHISFFSKPISTLTLHSSLQQETIPLKISIGLNQSMEPISPFAESNAVMAGGGGDDCNVSLFQPNKTFVELCKYVKESPGCNKNIYLQFLFCGILYNYLSWIFYILAIVLLCLIFYLLGNTSDHYFGPALLQISNYLRLNPTVAGCTLLAFGNAAAELSTIIIGVLRGNSGVGFGAPSGAGFYTTSFVYGAVCLATGTFQLARRPYIRDILFYFFSVAFALFLVVRRKIHIWESIFMLFIYIVYVIVVIAGRYINQAIKKYKLKKKEKQAQQNEATVDMELEENNSQEEFSSQVELVPSEEQNDASTAPVDLIQPSTKSTIKRNRSNTSTVTSMASLVSEQEKLGKHFKENGVYIPRIGLITMEKEAPSANENSFSKHRKRNKTLMYNKVVTKMEEEEKEEIPEEEHWIYYIANSIGWTHKKWYQKIFFVTFEWFFLLIRNLTIPKADPKEWNKFLTACVPIFSPLLIVNAVGMAIGMDDLLITLIAGVFPVSAVCVVVGFVFSILVLATTERRRAPIYFPVFVCYAFVMSIVWIYTLAHHLVSLIEAIGYSLSISPTLLALTFMAWGSALGETVADISIAKKGFPTMAISGVFAAPILDLLVGVGLSFTLKILFLPKDSTSNSYCVSIDSDASMMFLFVFILLSLTLSLLIVPICCKFKPNRCYGVFMIIVYVIGIIIAIVAALWKEFGDAVFNKVIITPGQGDCNIFV